MRDDAVREPAREARLTATQRTLVLWHELHPNSGAYNVIRWLRVAGHVDHSTLRAALGDLCERHEALRCDLLEREGEPMLVDSGRTRVELRPGSAGDLTEAAFLARVRDEAEQPFRNGDALWRVHVHRYSSASWIVLSLHHLIADLQATNVLLSDLATAYQSRSEGARPRFRTPAPSYLNRLRAVAADEGAMLAEDTRFWRQVVQEVDTVGPGPLPFSTGMQVRSDQAGDVVRHLLEPEASTDWDRRLKAWRATPAALCLASAASVLNGWYGTTRLLVGVPVVRPELLGGVGLSVTSLPVPISTPSDVPFSEVVADVTAALMDALDHSSADLFTIAQAVGNVSTSSLVNVWFNDMTGLEVPSHLGGISCSEELTAPSSALFDVNLYLFGTGSGYALDLVTPRGTLPPSMATRLLEQIAAAPTQTPWRQPPPPVGAYPVPATEILVAEHARSRPAATAVSTSSRRLTYADLDRDVDRLTAQFGRSVAAGEVVGLTCRRDLRTVVRMLALRRLGAVTALLDADWPPFRTAGAMNGSGALWTLDEDLQQHALAATQEPLHGRPGGSVVFTSGTTAGPAAVLSSAATIDGALERYKALVGLNAADRVSFTSAPAHDPVFRDVYAPLRAGARFCIPPVEALARPVEWVQWADSEGITVVHGTPLVLRVLAEAGVAAGLRLTTVRVVLSGGAPLTRQTVALIRRLIPTARVLNGYGSTETPQLVVAGDVTTDGEADAEGNFHGGEACSVGRPLLDRSAAVLDAEGMEVPPGYLGYVSFLGPVLADGYAPATPRPGFRVQADGTRTFTTGDLGRVGPDGGLYLAGRADRIRNVNGLRVDLNEVEEWARRCPGVSEAVAFLEGPSGSQMLTLYAQVSSGATAVAEHAAAGRITAWLTDRLPKGAVPARCVVTTQLPASPNGKPLAFPSASADVIRRSPTTVYDIVRALAQEVLGEDVDDHRNLFEAGFDSLTLLRLHALLTERLGESFPVLTVFRHPTLHALATALGSSEPDKFRPGPLLPQHRAVSHLQHSRGVLDEVRRRGTAE